MVFRCAYTAGRKINPDGCVNHSVGCAQPAADVFYKNMNKASCGWGVNAILGDFHKGDGRILITLPLDARPWGCGAGSKGSWNNSRIQWEVCEPAGHTYAGGTMIGYDVAKNQVYFDRMWKMLVAWNVYIRQKFGYPVANIADHAESYKAGMGSGHADMGHWLPKHGKSMDKLRAEVQQILNGSGSTPAPAPAPSTDGKTKIMGTAVATAAQMQAYIKGVNPSVAQSVIDMIPLYLSEGAVEGVRGDIAFAQSCLETGNFGFKGSAVTLDQNNFCGMGVTSNGVKGNSFATPQLGIRAQIQHLKAYASKDALKNATVDPRFQYVTRGCAEYVEWLGQKENPAGKGWASGAGYGASILTILKKVVATGAPASKTTMYRVRKTWADAASQIGAYTLLDNAKRSADAHPGYSVFDESGNAIYPVAAFTPYQVRVSISDLYIRSEPSKGSASRGFIAPGVYTVVEEQSGAGSTAGWGKLKSGAGWISLDYCKKI